MKIYSYIYCLRKLRNNQERTMISYAIFFILEISRGFLVILLISRNFYLHGK